MIFKLLAVVYINEAIKKYNSSARQATYIIAFQFDKVLSTTEYKTMVAYFYSGQTPMWSPLF